MDPLIDSYRQHVKTGQDLMNLKIISKTSAQHLALILARRLEALRDRAAKKLTPEILGSWIPAVVERTKTIEGEVADLKKIREYAKPKMHVEALQNDGNKQLKGLVGIIKEVKGGGNEFGVAWPQDIGGTNLDGKCDAGYGSYVSSEKVKLIIPADQAIRIPLGHELAQDVTANKKTGHKIRFAQDFTGFGWDYQSNREKISVKAGEARGTLINYDEKGKTLGISFEAGFPHASKKEWHFRLEDMCNCLQVSSRGQIEPQDREQLVYEHALRSLFPKTALEIKRVHRTLLALLAEKDIIIYGPPGSGKSTLAHDITQIAKRQRVNFVVEGCKVQCNPYSLFDAQFAKSVPPCPECIIRYCPEFKRTGFFVTPQPDKVKVAVTGCDQGFGVEFVEGTIDLKRIHLAGYKMPPELNASSSSGSYEDESDPAGYRPGVLPRANNGYLHFGEMDKLREQTLESLLEALQENRIKPDQLRFTMPAHEVIIGTANDHTKFPGPINDRMMLIAVRYSDSPDTRAEIRKKKGAYEPVERIDIGDTHRMAPLDIEVIAIPEPVQRAVDAFYIKFDAEYTGAGKADIMTSGRSTEDAFKIARAKLFVDKLFFANAPAIVDETYAVLGIQYALCSRVQEANRSKEKAAKGDLIGWVTKEFPALLQQETDTWWCRAYQDIAVRKTVAPQIEANFLLERELYHEDAAQAWPAYERIRQAYAPAATPAHQKSILAYPLMDYFWREQEGLNVLSKHELTQLVRYLMKGEEKCTCRIEK